MEQDESWPTPFAQGKIFVFCTFLWCYDMAPGHAYQQGGWAGALALCCSAWRRDGTGGPKSRLPVLQRGHLEGSGLFLAGRWERTDIDGNKRGSGWVSLWGQPSTATAKQCNREAVRSPSFKTWPGRSMSNLLELVLLWALHVTTDLQRSLPAHINL